MLQAAWGTAACCMACSGGRLASGQVATSVEGSRRVLRVLRVPRALRQEADKNPAGQLAGAGRVLRGWLSAMETTAALMMKHNDQAN